VRALITNDDGIDSAGLRTLARAAAGARAGLDVTIAAPDGERSGSGAALTGLAEDGRLLVDKRKLDGLEDVPTFAVQASPAMIAFAGTYGAFGERPEVVLAGINRGPNVGRAILHSGTVGAALTAASAGLPAMALSLASNAAAHWDTAVRATSRALEWFLPRAGVPVVVNVNVPDRPVSQIRGLRPARLVSYGAARAIIGEPGDGFIPLTFSALDEAPGPGTDLALIREGWVTVTVLTGLAESAALDVSDLGEMAWP
jgi:5'-nucleotidase